MQWIKERISRWRERQRRKRLEWFLDEFHAVCARERDPVLSDLVRLVWAAWHDGWSPRALTALYQVEREHRRETWRQQKQVG